MEKTFLLQLFCAESSCCFFGNFFVGINNFQTESLTGIGNPVLAGQELLKQGVRTKWVIVKMGAKGSILITTSSVSCAPAFKVLKKSLNFITELILLKL